MKVILELQGGRSLQRISGHRVSEAAGTKVLRELRESRSEIVTGPEKGQSVRVVSRPGAAAAWVDLHFAQ